MTRIALFAVAVAAAVLVPGLARATDPCVAPVIAAPFVQYQAQAFQAQAVVLPIAVTTYPAFVQPVLQVQTPQSVKLQAVKPAKAAQARQRQRQRGH